MATKLKESRDLGVTSVGEAYMRTAVICLSLLSSGTLAGNELAVAPFIHPVLYSVSDAAHNTVAKPLARRLGRYMAFWYVLIVSALFGS